MELAVLVLAAVVGLTLLTPAIAAIAADYVAYRRARCARRKHEAWKKKVGLPRSKGS